MRGDIVHAMSNNIDRSRVVLVFITRNYINKCAGLGERGQNDNCKFEFDYAVRRKGVEGMVPVVMERCVRDTKEWRGAVGGWLGGQRYFDAADDEGFERGVESLISEIRARVQSRRVRRLSAIMAR